MKKNPTINDLWQKEECPLIDGIIFRDGTIIEFTITNSVLTGMQFEMAKQTSLKELIAQKTVDYKCLYHSKIEKEYAPFKYMVGEGSWGGDGYIACFDLKTNDLLWIFTSDKINPIVAVKFLNGKLIAKNNIAFEFSLDINSFTKKGIIAPYTKYNTL